MITEKQKCIAEQAIYEDLQGIEKIEYSDHIEIYQYKFFSNGSVMLISGSDEYFEEGDEVDPLLILRPMSDLTEMITHKEYNDNKPFCPLVELAKLINPEVSWYYDRDYNAAVNSTYDNIVYYQDNILQYKDWSSDLYPIINYQQLWDHLIMWHFDTRNLIPLNEAISVHDLPKNPYEV